MGWTVFNGMPRGGMQKAIDDAEAWPQQLAEWSAQWRERCRARLAMEAGA